MKNSVFSFVAISLLISFNFKSALAADGSSGCGPGWYVFKENSLVSSAVRAITNTVLFPVSTIGMTVGTSNCTQHKLVTTEKESLHFVTMNYFEIKSEIVKGKGEYLSALANTMGCDQKHQKLFNQQIKRNYPSIFSTPKIDAESTLNEIYKTILKDTELTQSCSLRHVG